MAVDRDGGAVGAQDGVTVSYLLRSPASWDAWKGPGDQISLVELKCGQVRDRPLIADPLAARRTVGGQECPWRAAWREAGT